MGLLLLLSFLIDAVFPFFMPNFFMTKCRRFTLAMNNPG